MPYESLEFYPVEIVVIVHGNTRKRLDQIIVDFVRQNVVSYHTILSNIIEINLEALKKAKLIMNYIHNTKFTVVILTSASLQQEFVINLQNTFLKILLLYLPESSIFNERFLEEFLFSLDLMVFCDERLLKYLNMVADTYSYSLSYLSFVIKVTFIINQFLHFSFLKTSFISNNDRSMESKIMSLSAQDLDTKIRKLASFKIFSSLHYPRLWCLQSFDHDNIYKTLINFIIEVQNKNKDGKINVDDSMFLDENNKPFILSLEKDPLLAANFSSKILHCSIDKSRKYLESPWTLPLRELFFYDFDIIFKNLDVSININNEISLKNKFICDNNDTEETNPDICTLYSLYQEFAGKVSISDLRISFQASLENTSQSSLDTQSIKFHILLVTPSTRFRLALQDLNYMGYIPASLIKNKTSWFLN
ncbi:hypothetical protein MXB_2945 [Myxobolus squamalis]|nr:hypothetical protein MXB_2945 [Myxobolus squamalis]